RKKEREMSDQKSVFIIILFALLLFLATTVISHVIAADERAAVASKKKVIKVKSDSRIAVAKSEFTTRPGKDGISNRVSDRVSPSAADPAPTKLTLTFPTLVYPGENVKGRLKFNDPDDFVFSIFITVFFPDGDVVTDSLYDYRIDGGDIWKGTINFTVEMPDSDTPLPGKIIITCADEYLNVSEVSTNFVQPF
ncbi:MAG: hypothetical protein MI702_09120, partial [Chlorobiales bacterium]|nr:hypothetical protein [Chlorobiales bacterium]